ncbi:hypothetical protein B0181_07000 [Moraxella caviae]|uniref:DUF5672 domain-containing protein n=1 Tax=Moraxella caviae TaxID=34060 RepID=A0A1T0A117_9GAMM|nr:DUF5672 family protein [Moraxella caviae]OOR89420.1 hypothetical protein B0181_07000 [Moraxella caviae]STZ09856.1 Uncharacterised protein [Moraxella caviae]VEW13068.1 Uncharacterised protein [Moraxella caviae]
MRNNPHNTKTHNQTLTIVSVTGHQAYAEGSVFAILRSRAELLHRFPDVQCLLVSPEKPHDLPDEIRHICCSPFSYFEYNLFMVYMLGSLIDTDFALVVQNDGWVIDGTKWRDEFLEYDYIGAPIAHFYEIHDHEPTHFYDHMFWAKHWQNPPQNLHTPQNGGFSLRSRKLLDAPRALNLEYKIHAPNAFNPASGKPVGIKWGHGGYHEDVYLTTAKRQLLEQHGIKFAPLPVAALFSMEMITCQICYQIPIDEVFGAHFCSGMILTGTNSVLLADPFYHTDEMLSNFPTIKRLKDLGYQLYLDENTPA